MSSITITLLLFLAAKIAASFRRFSISAPEKPVVILATVLNTTSDAKGLFLEWTLKISSLPFTSGRPTTTFLSKRPGLNNAGSSTSALFVAAITIISSFFSNPSIWTSNWLSVCSLSSFPPPSPAPLCLPTASISSIKTIHGWFFFAWSNKSLTLAAPVPSNISTKSEPLIEKKGTLLSPATALANKVLPVPGGPTSNTPFGILAPSFVNFCGSFKNSTISFNSSFSSSAPATSENLTVTFFVKRALIFPNPIACLFCPPICLKIKNKTTNINTTLIIGIM